MNISTTTLVLGTRVDGMHASGQTGYEFEIVELVEIPAGKNAESYDDKVILQFALARVAAARVWNATRALMISLGDVYFARGRLLDADRDAPFSDRDIDIASWSYPASFRSLSLTANNRERSAGAPRDPSALAQCDAWCAELHAAMLRFVAEDTRCYEADACFSEFLEEKMRIVGVASRNWFYPAECAFESSAVRAHTTTREDRESMIQ